MARPPPVVTGFLTFTRCASELRALVPLTRAAWFSGAAEGMALILTEGEWEVERCPLVHRFYHEYALSPPPSRPRELEAWVTAAARRALLEERPRAAVFPHRLGGNEALAGFCRELGVRVLLWPDRPPREAPRERYFPFQADAVGGLDPGEVPGEVEVLAGPEEFPEWLARPGPAPPPRVALAEGQDPLPEQAVRSLAARLPPGPCLVVGPKAPRIAGRLAPYHRDLHVAEGGEGGVPLPFEDGAYPSTATLLGLAHSLTPQHLLAESFRVARIRSLHLVPVNLPLAPGLPTFRYGTYDNEYALGPADYDLREMAGRLPGPVHLQAEVLGGRGGGQALWEDPGLPGRSPEAPDGSVPLLMLQLDRAPVEPRHWTDRFALPRGRRMRLVFVDSENIAGSVLNHALAVNRYTDHEAIALTARRHPFIDYPEEECRVRFLKGDAGRALARELEQADCFIFFEDDDETRPVGGLVLQPYVRGKRVVHLYIGQRVHRDPARHRRPGRLVLTPLPHLLRIYPEAHFYAGFPPATLEELEVRPPRSRQDGVVRLLHTPSLPHPTLSRYYYHKDTDAFLRAARRLKKRYGDRLEIWQLGGLPHRLVLQARLDCDITFNQLRGHPGLSGSEAMYLGRPVVQSFDRYNRNRHLEYWGLDVEFPWVEATRENLAEVLAALIEDPARREAVGRASREFMLEYFSAPVGVLPLLWYCSQAPVAQA